MGIFIKPFKTQKKKIAEEGVEGMEDLEKEEGWFMCQ